MGPAGAIALELAGQLGDLKIIIPGSIVLGALAAWLGYLRGKK